MKIHNIRHGFATNSSSSHSIVFLPKGVRRPGEEAAAGDYGWQDFVLTSPEEKARYLRTQYREGGADDYVDHQSEWNNEGFSFVDRVTGMTSASPEGRALLERIMANSQVIVLGGNDNQDPHHNLAPDLERAGASFLGRDGYTVINDPKGHVVFFDSRSGTKFRVTLDDSGAEPTKGTWPELLDVKITDFCSYGCSYCYQGSTEKGNHAPLEYLAKLAAKLRESGVLEVALGGGEPTLHPDFPEIVRLFKAAGVIVNVTSRNVQFWAKVAKEFSKKKTSDERFNMQLPKAVAFSIDSAADLKKVMAAFGGSLPWGSFEVHFQVVAGAVTDEEFGKILDAADGARVTLLGYKLTGRGKEAMKGLPVFDAPEQTGWVAEWAKRAAAAQVSEDAIQAWRAREHVQYEQTHYDSKRMDAWREKNPEPEYVAMPVVAIDTTLAAICREALAQHGVPKVLYSTSEGSFSAYIDAVDEALGPCSYVPDRMRPVDLDRLWSDFAEMQPLIQ